MARYKQESIKMMLKKAAQGTVISAVAIGLIFGALPREMLYEYILQETLPFYGEEGEQNIFFKIFAQNEPVETPPAEVELVPGTAYLDEPYESVFAAGEMIPAEAKLVIGINDIIFQDEDEFGPLPDSGYKENFTAGNIDRLSDRDYFISSFYNKDSKTGVIKSLFDPDKFIAANLKEIKTPSQPQVLIFHTHGGTEYFIDSDTSDLYEGIIGAGAQLKYVLENKYGINAIHHTGIYDMVDGVSQRDGSYERMEPEIEQILKENPSISIVIDLHRDGIEPNPNLVTYIDGKPCAKIMFVNGTSALDDGDEIKELNYLKNENLEGNLAFSFNMQIAANELYPDFTRKILLKPYRFSTHMRQKSLLVEIGSQYNTKEEAFNAMEILADLIESVVFDGI